jgi:hypothetical protein
MRRLLLSPPLAWISCPRSSHLHHRRLHLLAKNENKTKTDDHKKNKPPNAAVVDSSRALESQIAEDLSALEVINTTKVPLNIRLEEKKDDLVLKMEKLLLKTAACTELPRDEQARDNADANIIPGASLMDVFHAIDLPLSSSVDAVAGVVVNVANSKAAVLDCALDIVSAEVLNNARSDTETAEGTTAMGHTCGMIKNSATSSQDRTQRSPPAPSIPLASTLSQGTTSTSASVGKTHAARKPGITDNAKESKTRKTLGQEKRIPSYARATAAGNRCATFAAPHELKRPIITRAHNSVSSIPKVLPNRYATSRANGSGIGRPDSATSIASSKTLRLQSKTRSNPGANVTPSSAMEAPKKKAPNYMRGTAASSSGSSKVKDSEMKRHRAAWEVTMPSRHRMSKPGCAIESLGSSKMMELLDVPTLSEEVDIKNLNLGKQTNTAVVQKATDSEMNKKQTPTSVGGQHDILISDNTTLDEHTHPIEAVDILKGVRAPPLAEIQTKGSDASQADYQHPDPLDSLLPQDTGEVPIWFYREPIPPIDSAFSDSEED